MTVYVDPMQSCVTTGHWHHPQACHLYADALEELHEFARKVGLKREWFQNREFFQHYDLNETKRREAVSAGAVEQTLRQVVEEMQRRRAEILASRKERGHE